MTTRTSPAPGLCLIAEARNDSAWLARCAAALDAAAAATLIVTAPDGADIDAGAAGALVAMAQQKGIAALIEDDWQMALTLSADGVHLTARPEISEAYRAAREGLGAGAIVGADAGLSRHDAMTLGEAGADYVAFAPEDPSEDAEADHAERVAWWAEVFVVPVVAFAITAEQAGRIAGAKPDFIATPIPSGTGIAVWASELADAVSSARKPAVSGAAS